MEDNRQFMSFIVSTDESKTSSGSKLFQLSPSTRTSDSSDGCSSISFPKLQMLVLESCALFEINLFRTFDCGSTLNLLDLTRSDIFYHSSMHQKICWVGDPLFVCVRETSGNPRTSTKCNKHAWSLGGAFH